MATPTSGWFVQTLLMSFTQTAQTGTPTSLNFATNANDANMKIALYGSGATQYAAPIIVNSATLGVWTSAQEVVSSAGSWTTSGGITLSTAATGSSDVSQTLTNPVASPATLKFTWANALSVATTTFTGVYGFVVYFQSITAPLSAPELIEIYVGTGYNTVAGIFGITPAGTGLSVITLSA